MSKNPIDIELGTAHNSKTFDPAIMKWLLVNFDTIQQLFMQYEARIAALEAGE